MSQIPQNYDGYDKVIDVDPREIYESAHIAIPAAIDGIVDAWIKVGDAWNESQIGWVGSSKDAADTFNNTLQDLQKRLFGVKDKSGNVTPGILDKIRSGAVNAYYLFGEVEKGNAKMFNDFADAIETPAPKSQIGADGLPVPPKKPDAINTPVVTDSFDT